MHDPPINALQNLGPRSAAWLRAVGIDRKSQLEAIGSVGAWCLLREAGFRVSLLLVYAIEAALLDMHWTELPLELRDTLRQRAREREPTLP